MEENTAKERADEFLNYLTSVISDRHFIMDYNELFPIQDDLEMLHQFTSDMYPFINNFNDVSLSLIDHIFLKSMTSVMKQKKLL